MNKDTCVGPPPTNLALRRNCFIRENDAAPNVGELRLRPRKICSKTRSHTIDLQTIQVPAGFVDLPPNLMRRGLSDNKTFIISKMRTYKKSIGTISI